MRTVGVDLASQDAKTAYCVVDWTEGHVRIGEPVLGASDSDLLCVMADAEAVGIDAPFGWPEAMVEAMAEHAAGRPWPAAASAEALRYRTTDRYVNSTILEERGTKVWPLSVSSDRIAYCAWRCGRLLRDHASSTGWAGGRLGSPDGGVCIAEVYPAGALAMWGITHKGYKGKGSSVAEARSRRSAIVDQIALAAGSWLRLPAEVRTTCAANDDALDALVSALVARAAASGLTRQPDPVQAAAAAREGWIHLPLTNSLPLLGSPRKE